MDLRNERSTHCNIVKPVLQRAPQKRQLERDPHMQQPHLGCLAQHPRTPATTRLRHRGLQARPNLQQPVRQHISHTGLPFQRWQLAKRRLIQRRLRGWCGCLTSTSGSSCSWWRHGMETAVLRWLVRRLLLATPLLVLLPMPLARSELPLSWHHHLRQLSRLLLPLRLLLLLSSRCLCLHRRGRLLWRSLGRSLSSSRTLWLLLGCCHHSRGCRERHCCRSCALASGQHTQAAQAPLGRLAARAPAGPLALHRRVGVMP